MVQASGTFEHVSYSPEFEDFLRAAGSSEEFIKGVLAVKPTVTVGKAGEDKVTISTRVGEKEKSLTFKLGEVYDDPQRDGSVAKTLVDEKSGKKATILYKLAL